MNKLLCIIALMALTATAQAGPFIGLTYGMGEGDVGDFTLAPTHPVATQLGGGPEDKDDYKKLTLGYQWDGGWYAEAGVAKFGTLFRSRNSSGADATFTYSTNNRLRAETDAIVASLGKSFALGLGFGLFAEAGIHRFEREVTETRTLTQTNNTTFVTTQTVTEQTRSDKDTDGVYTVGVSMDLAKRARFFIFASHYAGIDIDASGVGLALNF